MKTELTKGDKFIPLRVYKTHYDAFFLYMCEREQYNKRHFDFYYFTESTEDKYDKNMSYYADWYAGSNYRNVNDETHSMTLYDFFNEHKEFIYPTIINMRKFKFDHMNGFTKLREECLEEVMRASSKIENYPYKYLIDSEEFGLL